jgi:toxin FitB
VSGFLLDTNVPSELIRPLPDPSVGKWLRSQDKELLFLSVVTIGELRKGFTILPASERRRKLEQWFEADVLSWFEGRILPVTQAIAGRWGVFAGKRQLSGARLNTADGMIAGTAAEHGLTVVTRNLKDFRDLGVEIFDPWSG